MLFFVNKNDPIIGKHVQFKNSKISDSIYSAIIDNDRTLQIFMGANLSIKRSNITNDDVILSKRLISQTSIHLFTHLPYIFNLAGSKEILAWNNNELQDNKTMAVIRSIEYEVNKIGELYSNNRLLKYGCVLHPGNHIDKKLGIQAISQSLDKIKFNIGSYLLLENSPGAGTSIGSTLHELCEIYNSTKNKEHIKICIDTCHLFVAGSYNLSKKEEIDRLFIDFINLFGDIDNLFLIHFNDSKGKFNSKLDRHEYPGKGFIWQADPNSMEYFIEKCKSYNIPMVIEM